jgi:hypothetical protein
MSVKMNRKQLAAAIVILDENDLRRANFEHVADRDEDGRKSVIRMSGPAYVRSDRQHLEDESLVWEIRRNGRVEQIVPLAARRADAFGVPYIRNGAQQQVSN